MLSRETRLYGREILKRKGVIKPQTQQEKNKKAFDKYTLSAEEIKRRNEERKEKERKAALRA